MRWPTLRGAPALGRAFEPLAEYRDTDYRTLRELLSFLVAHPRSDLFPRQLPVEGMHTKWMESRRGLVVDLLTAVRGSEAVGDFFDVCGLRRPPHRLRILILCPVLRRLIGNLRDVEAPVDELAALALPPMRVLIVENVATGIALPDMPGTVAFIGLGNAVSVLAKMGWARGVPALYWGDLDTHGIAILNGARSALAGGAHVASILMDEETLLAHRHLWVEEEVQHRDAEFPHLTPVERALFDRLRANLWETRVRLEQEHVPWTTALAALARGLGA